MSDLYVMALTVRERDMLISACIAKKLHYRGKASAISRQDGDAMIRYQQQSINYARLQERLSNLSGACLDME